MSLPTYVQNGRGDKVTDLYILLMIHRHAGIEDCNMLSFEKWGY